MTEPGELYRIAERFRRELARNERAAASEMVRYYGQAWQRIRTQIDHLTKQYWQRVQASEEVPASWLFELERLQTLQRQVEAEIRTFAHFAETRITAEQWDAVQAAQQHSLAIAQAALPPGASVAWNRLPTGAVSELVGFLQDGSPLRSLLDELGPQASEQVRSALISGLALGQHPSEIARACRQALGGNLVRALTLARTATFTAYREATRRIYEQNSDVVKGWVRLEACDGRTCPSCFALHGTEYRTPTRFESHPCCRGTLAPKLRSWQELGFRDVPETATTIEKGPVLFEKLPDAEKLRVLGPTGFAAYKAGAVQLKDFVGWRTSKQWGKSLYSKSLTQILGKEHAKELVAQTRAVKTVEEKRLTDLTQRMLRPFERITKLKSRWSGVLDVKQTDPGLLGVKEWGCEITISRAIISDEAALLPTLNHEVLHSFSNGLERQAYRQFRGWEEGVVEQLQRIHGPRALKALGLPPHTSDNAYNLWITEIESLRTFLGRDKARFYLQLLRTPLAQREQLVLDMGQRLPVSRQPAWQTLLDRALPRLRNPEYY